MDLGKKIYELRKLNHITQEQLAQAVGVSTPAVCKWETGISMPDITLLSPIARKLNTNLDELLSFQASLSQNEITEIVNEVKNIARTEGLNEGLKKCNFYRKEYPNVEELSLRLAMLPSMMAHTAEEEYWIEDNKFQRVMEETTLYLEELTHSSNEIIRNAAITAVISRYMGQNRLDEAEVLLNKISGQTYNPRHILPSLYFLKGEEVKALENAQRNLLQDVQLLLGDIREQHNYYIKKEDFHSALKCAKDYYEIVQITGTTTVCPSELLLDTYLAKNDRKIAMKYFLTYLGEIENISGDFENTFYYSKVEYKSVEASTEVKNDIRSALYKYVLHHERFQELVKLPEAAEKLAKLKRILSKPK